MKRIFFILLLLSFTHLSKAQTSLQPYHWAWPYLDYLKTAGYLPNFNMTDRPWQKEDIYRALQDINLKTIPGSTAQMITLLKQVFSPNSSYAWHPGDSSVVLRPGGFARLNFIHSDFSSDKSFQYEVHPLLQANIGSHVTLYANYKIFNNIWIT